MHTESLSATDIERLAHKRAAARLGWAIHAAVFLVVNLALLAGSAITGYQRGMAPTLVWGLGLLIHGTVVRMGSPGTRLYQRLLQRELRRLQPQRDPW